MIAETNSYRSLEVYAWLNPHLALNVDWNTAWRVARSQWECDRLRRLDQVAAEPCRLARTGTTSASQRSDGERDRLCARTTARRACRCAILSASFAASRARRNRRRFAMSSASPERETLADSSSEPNAAVNLLNAMQQASRPVKLGDLGLIGEAMFCERLIDDHCEPESIVYRKAEIEHGGVPYVIEVAFGYRHRLLTKPYGRRSSRASTSPRPSAARRSVYASVWSTPAFDGDDPVTVFAH